MGSVRVANGSCYLSGILEKIGAKDDL